MRLLVVDDDRDLVDVLTFALRRAGYLVLAAHDPVTALRLLETEEPLLAVLDVNLGESDGFELLKQVRQRSNIPVIMLTGRQAEDDKLRGFDLGADDYVTKPFSHRELVARIRANLKRHGQNISVQVQPRGQFAIGPVSVNEAEHRVEKGGQPVKLSVTEFRLLVYLMLNAGTLVPTRLILKQVWGYDDTEGTDVVRVTMHRLRQKLEDDPNHPRLLHTVPGVGVMFKAVDA